MNAGTAATTSAPAITAGSRRSAAMVQQKTQVPAMNSTTAMVRASTASRKSDCPDGLAR
jgi:hypothetical protein